ncbi:AGAP000914-PA-like protein [Anopheles sinensis]|uniref:AGAP000914-PA-like protein n=1 Tax=Anopheles sinensis TaxID=74873 RepID=A0A084VVB1_ANOSI|nr:AGAP000914-PA-like protein [Anopheles sinensis]
MNEGLSWGGGPRPDARRNCSGCDSLFPSLMLLEHHKEEFEHWSDYEEDGRLPCCRRNRRDDDDYTDTDTGTSDAESEDLERLL